MGEIMLVALTGNLSCNVENRDDELDQHTDG